VVNNIDNGLTTQNTTYTIDICQALKKVKGIDNKKQCPNGSRVCSITRRHTKEPKSDEIEEIFPIAGELREREGKDLDAKWERTKNQGSHSESDVEGVRVTLNGGFRKENDKKIPQKAIIEFICDKSKTGLENLPNPEDPYTEDRKRDEDHEDDEGDKTPSLEFVKYKEEDNVGVLRLKWTTEYACEESKKEQDKEKGEHWGFFTWFIIIAFLSTATYLIFGSWLNYNRYGARGWDLLPHGDTIRDVPYLLKDWTRRVLNTVQGGGSRGGYAAV